MLVWCGLFLLAPFVCCAQGVRIGDNQSPPHPTAGLEIEFTDKGLLPPRLTSAQRDAIQNPAPGLRIYNTDSGCENYYNGNVLAWMEVCGTCVPQPTASHAGADKLNVQGSSAVLAANTPLIGSGTWSIVQGNGGEVAVPGNPNSTFNGVAGTSYTLRWTIQNVCGLSQDDVVIAFASLSKRVFVSSTTTTGNMGGLTGADNICQARANAASLGGIWKAWLSSSTISAASRLTQSSAPYTLVDGTVIAANWADLTDGSISNPINRTEFGAITGNGAVWTHTTAAGAAATTNAGQVCSDWTVSTSGNTLIHCAGSPFQTTGDWTAGYSGCSYPCNSQFPLFCFEQ